MFTYFSNFLLWAVYPSMVHSNKSWALHFHYIYIYNSAGRKRTNQFSAGNLGNLGHFFQAYSISDMRKLGIIFPTFSTFPRFPSFQFTIFPFFKKKKFPRNFPPFGYRTKSKTSKSQKFLFFF